MDIAGPPRDREPASGAPVSDDAFAGMMAAVGPFEANPRLAVAVSGGGDSMALCLLAQRWAGRRGGSTTALTVDHGLRPEAADEARQVGRWLKARGIAQHVLEWRGPKPVSGIQAAARAARYGLMTAWAREAGVLHLLLAHHQEDQAETFLLRLERGSGIDGLSAMAAVVETPAVRLVRPLLGVPRARLRATARAFGQEWLEDPSNRDAAFARTRIRAALPALARSGMSPALLAERANRVGHVRIALENAASALLAVCCTVHPAGYARLDQSTLAAAPEDVSFRALARILMCVGGREYAPRREKLERLHAVVVGGKLGKARTLGGCRILAERYRILVCREARGMPEPLAAVPGTQIVWDGRFVIRFAATGNGAPRPRHPAHLTRLGREGWAEVVADRPDLKAGPVPAAVRLSLPALRDEWGVFTVPHLYYTRSSGRRPGVGFGRITFCPPNSISGVGFRLA